MKATFAENVGAKREISTKGVGFPYRLRWLAVLAPTLTLLVLDVGLRGRALLQFRWLGQDGNSIADKLRGAHALAYSFSLFHGALLWGSLLVLASCRRRRLRRLSSVGFIALFATSLGVQAAFFTRWHTYLTRDATELSAYPVWAVLGSHRGQPGRLWPVVVGLAIASLLVLFARRLVRPNRRVRQRASAVLGVSLVAALLVPVSYRDFQATAPDLLWLNAAARAASGPEAERRGMSSVQLRSPRALPTLDRAPTRPRNVVLLLQESQRADVTCIGYDRDCKLATQATNRVVPQRLALENVRSNASVTTIAMGVLLTGLPPTAPAAEMRSAPNLFEYAHAAGYDTAYFTSQHLMFANMWLAVQDIPSGKLALASHLDATPDMFTGASDAALARKVQAEWNSLTEPFFAVVHFSNIHAPRRSFAEVGPFLPASQDKGNKEHYFNNYKNSVYESDNAVAELIRSIQATPAGSRTVLLYTSDHGESVSEHGQGCDHGCSLFEEDIRVAAWVDAPEGTLSASEQKSLELARSEYVFHLDFAPTMLDLLGLWDLPSLAEERQRMPGSPLTRPAVRDAVIPLSNVAHYWERGLPSYGLMRRNHKLIGRHRDPGYACYDIALDPDEKNPISGNCDGLLSLAGALYQVPPCEFDRLENYPQWGHQQ